MCAFIIYRIIEYTNYTNVDEANTFGYLSQCITQMFTSRIYVTNIARFKLKKKHTHTQRMNFKGEITVHSQCVDCFAV